VANRESRFTLRIRGTITIAGNVSVIITRHPIGALTVPADDQASRSSAAMQSFKAGRPPKRA
jgi:hypothetical protein